MRVVGEIRAHHLGDARRAGPPRRRRRQKSSVARSLPDEREAHRREGDGDALDDVGDRRASARSPFMNFSRAGVAKNRSRTSTMVPRLAGGRPHRRDAAALDADLGGAVGRRRCASGSSAATPSRSTAAPRRGSRASGCRGCRRRASRCSGARPRARARRPPCRAPSSLTRISASPPPAVAISIAPAPASSAFSTSSLTTLAGRSITSPAAIWLIMVSESWRIGMAAIRPDSRAGVGKNVPGGLLATGSRRPGVCRRRHKFRPVLIFWLKMMAGRSFGRPPAGE